MQTNGCFTDYVEGMVENSHKLELFLDILDETIMVGDRLLLFSQSLFTLTLIEDYLKRRQIPGECMISFIEALLLNRSNSIINHNLLCWWLVSQLIAPIDSFVVLTSPNTRS